MQFQRRSFLKSAAAATVWAGSAPAIFSQSNKSGKKLRLGVIGGGGWWAMNILRVALEDGRCECVALCDVDADGLEVSADDVEVRSISMRAYRVGYLPMRALWQVWPRGGRAVVSAMARTDAGAKDARHGFVLATAGRRA